MNQDELDQLLREAHEPPPGVAQRLARRALDEGGGAPRRSPRTRPWLRPALAAVALLALVAVSWRVVPHLAPSASTRVAERPAPGASAIPGADPAATPDSPRATAGPAVRLSISNLDGPVTVTTADGTRWIALSSGAASATPPETTGDPLS